MWLRNSWQLPQCSLLSARYTHGSPPFPPPLHLTKEQSNADFTKAEIRSSLPPCSAACAYLVSARCCAKGTQQFRMKILNSNEHDTYVMIIMAIITIITSYS